MADYEYDDYTDSPVRGNQKELTSTKQSVEITKKQATGAKDKKDNGLEPLDIEDDFKEKNKLRTVIDKTDEKPKPKEQRKSPGNDYDDDFEEDDAPKQRRVIKGTSPNETQDLNNAKGEPKNFADKPISLQAKNDMVSPQYQKLKDQNRKLKEELKELAKAADEALQRERQNKTVKRNKEEDPELKEKMQELKEQLGKIDQLKHQTTIMKRQLQNTYNLPKVVEKEDELKAAKKELARVTEEKNSLLKIKKEQNKALDFLNNEGEYDKRLKQVTQELRQLKEDYKKENELYMENEKAMKKMHEKIIMMEEKSRDLQKKVKEKKGDKIKNQGNPDINEDNMNALEAKIKDFQDKKAFVERNFEEEMKALDKKKKNLGLENEKLALQVKEKEKEIRLNNLRLKELKKLTRYNAVKPLESQKETVTTTMNRASSRESHEDDKSNFVTQTKSSDTRNVQKKPLQRVDNSQEVKKAQNQKPKPTDEDDGDRFEEEEIDYEEQGDARVEEDDELPSKAFNKPTVGVKK